VRVAFVCRNFNLRGGVSRDAYLFARQLVELGADVHVYGNAQTSTPEAGMAFHGVPTRRLFGSERLGPPAEHGLFAYRATQAIRRRRRDYDVVYVTGTEAWEQDAVRVHAVVKAENRRWPERGGRHFKAARARARLGLLTRPQNVLERSIQRHQFRNRRFRRLVAATEEVRDDLCTMFRVSAGDIDVLPYPIDVEAIRTAPPAGVRSSFRLGLDDVVLLFLGNDFYRKGLDESVRVLAQLPPNTHLVVVGSGDTSRYTRLSEQLGVAARVHFAGATETPEGFLKDADVFFLPTREDVWGIALIEAMAAGVPVVTSAAAGASSIVREAGAGIVVDDYETRSFVEALRALVTDPERRHSLGARGPVAAGVFDARHLAPRLVSALERAAHHT
jgi:glycosyltransferase involved in cell wall biosynthesis